MLLAVLNDEALMEYGEYGPEECTSLVQALSSDNYVVNAVARIIARGQEELSENEIYKEVNDYLKRMV